MDSIEVSARERALLKLQETLGWAMFSVVGPSAIFYMRVLRGNRIEGVDAARRVYREAFATGRPTIICGNHLTMTDSLYLLHAMGSVGDYLRDFRRFSWNVPATENFTHTLFLRTLVYLGKTIPIDRTGSASHHKSVLDKLTFLVSSGQVCTLFPEGGRSRTGRVEPANVTYGVGQILNALDRPQVVCVYLRGERQTTWGEYPAIGDTLHLRVETIEPRTQHRGLRAVRDLSRQVIVHLKSMENRHFARFGEPEDSSHPV